MCKLIGLGNDELEVFQSTALLKPPGGREKPWHQDHAYFPLRGDRRHVVSSWTALDHIPRETSLRFWKGSHAPAVGGPLSATPLIEDTARAIEALR